ncbi:MAG: hypothetical protein LBS02_03930 [Hungatella sp.]|jgi:hypothetical protein|nr:hypothetical protein [Hungatella sp.]
MCKILISPEEKIEQFNFIVYNIVFSEKSGTVTTEKVYQRLKFHQINVERIKLERLLESWADMGILFDNEEEYVINSF